MARLVVVMVALAATPVLAEGFLGESGGHMDDTQYRGKDYSSPSPETMMSRCKRGDADGCHGARSYGLLTTFSAAEREKVRQVFVKDCGSWSKTAGGSCVDAAEMTPTEERTLMIFACQQRRHTPACRWLIDRGEDRRSGVDWRAATCFSKVGEDTCAAAARAAYDRGDLALSKNAARAGCMRDDKDSCVIVGRLESGVAP